MTDITPHESSITRETRNSRNGHPSYVLWFTGLSASGKSTLANALSVRLFDTQHQVMVLDGDSNRAGLCKDLGFEPEDRRENIRRIGEVSKLFVESGQITITAYISPLQADRNMVRDIIGMENFLEVFVDCPLDACVRRDPKGLYARAMRGEIKSFTGITAMYEPPANPDITVNTFFKSVEQCVDQIVSDLRLRGLKR